MSTATLDKNKYFDSAEFLKAKDIKDGQTVQIEAFEEIMTRLSKDKPRPCLRLKGIDLPFGLNVTNFDMLVEKFGDNAKAWIGKKVRLVKVRTRNPQEGKEVDAIRIA